MDDIESLRKLLAGVTPCVLISTQEESTAREVVAQAVMGLNMDVLCWTVIDGVMEGLDENGPVVTETANPAAGILFLGRKQGRFIAIAFDLVEHLKDARTLRVMRELVNRFEQTGSTLVLVDHQDELPACLRTYCSRFELSYPDANEIEQLVKSTLRQYHQRHPIQINMTQKELHTIIRNLRGLTHRQIRQIILELVMDDQRLDQKDINRLLAKKRQMLQSDGLLDYVEAPAELNEVGGLNRLKHWLQQRQEAMTDEAAAFGIESPRGVLMLGVQGAGKSLCAKAIATAWHRPLLRMDSGALYDKYIGESERRLRQALRQAEMMAPIVLWIDEIEKAFASAASRSSDGGLSQRMFGTLLTWMQEHRSPVFLVATANDIEALPPELLRKGRFDEIFFVDLPTRQTRKKIFEIHLRKRKRNPDIFDLGRLADVAKDFSGAEIEQAVISALHDSYSNKADLNTEMIAEVIKSSPPLSVTMAEKIAELRLWAKDRCVPAE